MLAFLHTFRHWIAEHTGGVVVLQLRDTPKDLEVKPSSGSLVARMLDPVESVYDNVIRIQDQDYDLMMRQASGWTHFPLEVIDVELRHGSEERISLSWHLTALERKRVLRSIDLPNNRVAFRRLVELVEGGGGPVSQDGAGGPDQAADRVPRP